MLTLIARLILAIVFACTTALAHGQAPEPPVELPPNVGGTFFSNLSAAANAIKAKAGNSVSEGLFSAGLTYSKPTVAWALAIAGSLATLYLIVESIGVISGKNSSMIVVLFDVGLPAVFTAYLLINYEPLILTFAGKGGLLDFIRNIGGDATLTVMDMYSAVLKLITTSITEAWAGYTSAFKLGPNMLGGIFGSAINVLGTILFSLVIIALCLAGLAEIIGLILMGPFLCAIAVAFGPIFICTLVSPWTREYFGRWVGFLVASSVLTGVVSICVGVATSLFQTFNFAEIAGDSHPSATALLIAAVLIMSINSLIQQAPAIASALVPGSVGASKGSGNAVKDGWKMVGGKAKAIGDTAKGVTDKAKGKMDKKKDPPPSAGPSPTASSSRLDQTAGGSSSSKYPTIGL